MNIPSIERSPRSQGKRELHAHMLKKPLTRSKAMAAKCFECCNGYLDGRVDCKITNCPLYPWMPYAKVESDEELELGDLPAIA